MDVLAAIDGSEPGYRALAFAIDLAERFGGTIHVVSVVDEDGGVAEEWLDRARLELSDAGLETEPEVHQADLGALGTQRDVAAYLLDLVDDRDIDHVAVGRHGHSPVDRTLLGSCAETLVEEAPIPVTVVP